MSHLRPAEFIDLADGTLPRERAGHVEGCAACRTHADALRDTLAGTDPSTAVPEPSPLFWDQFSARVREAVSETPQPSAFAWGWRGLRPIAAALAVLLLVVSAVFLSREARSRQMQTSLGTPAAVATADQVAEPALDPGQAAAWAVLTAAADDLHFDDARDAGIDVPSAAVDRAVTQLTRDELSELGRLLQSEMKGSSH